MFEITATQLWWTAALAIAVYLLVVVWPWVEGRIEAYLPEPRPTAPSEALTVEEVHRRAEQTLRRHGGIYRVTITRSGAVAFIPIPRRSTRRVWVDVTRYVSRESEGRAATGSVSIWTPTGAFHRHDDGSVEATSPRRLIVSGATIATATALRRPEPAERSTTEVRRVFHRGRLMIVLVTSGTINGSDATDHFTQRLYLDPETCLPVEAVETRWLDCWYLRLPGHGRATYAHDFLPIDAVPADFFDPASIGYVPADPEAAFPATPTIPVYWLGRALPPSGDRPGLVLAAVLAHNQPHRPEPSYRYILDYALADDPFGPAAVSIQLWPADEWAASNPRFRAAPGWSHQDFDIADRRASIYSRTADSTASAAHVGLSRPRDTHLAIAHLDGGTVAMIGPGAYSHQNPTGPNPYDTHDGMSAIITALHPRHRR